LARTSPRPAVVARASCALASTLAIVLGARDALGWLAVRAGAPEISALPAALASDAELRVARARGALAAADAARAASRAGEAALHASRARAELEAALAARPRDPDALLELAGTVDAPIERLRFARLCVRVAPHRVAPAEFAFRVAFAAVEERAPRAAAARETARRLEAGARGAGAEARAEASRLDDEMRAVLDAALAVHAETSSTARGSRFLADALARARGLRAELDGP